MAPNPIAIEAVRIKRFRRVKGTVLIMRIPETATAEKRKVVMPPNTELGMATRAAANFENIPITTRKKQAQYPALRFAHRVSAIMPLFCAKVLTGVFVARQERSPLRPSAKTPP